MKRIFGLVIIFISFLLLESYILGRHYVAIGECTEITYYKPLTLWDRIVFVAISVIALIVSIKLTKPKRVGTILLSVIYIVQTVAFSIFGDHLLEMPTKRWTQEYHLQPMESKVEINYSDKFLFGCWKRTYYEPSADSVTFLSPLIEFSDDNMFANGDTMFYYTYHLQQDTLTIHRPNNGYQEYKVLRLTRSDFTVKLISDEIFDIGPIGICDSITLSFKRVPITHVAKFSFPTSDL